MRRPPELYQLLKPPSQGGYADTKLGHEMSFLKGNRKTWPSFLSGGRWEGEDSLKEICWHAFLWRNVFKAPNSKEWWCEREEGILTRTETAKYKIAASHITVSGSFLPSTLLDYIIFSTFFQFIKWKTGTLHNFPWRHSLKTRKRMKEERRKVFAKANFGVMKLFPLGSLYSQERLFQLIVGWGVLLAYGPLSSHGRWDTGFKQPLWIPSVQEQLSRPAYLAWNVGRATISKLHSSTTLPALHFAVLGKGSRLHLL